MENLEGVSRAQIRAQTESGHGSYCTAVQYVQAAAPVQQQQAVVFFFGVTSCEKCTGTGGVMPAVLSVYLVDTTIFEIFGGYRDGREACIGRPKLPYQ